MQLPAQAELILQSRCRMGECSEIWFGGKTLLEERGRERLYEIEIAYRSTPIGEEPNGPFYNQGKSYVLCSHSRPRHIFKDDDSERYHSVYLNPGVVPGAEYEDHILYWTTCHNIVGPNFFSDEMRQRAIDLGYSLGLPFGSESGSSLEAILPW